MYGLDKAPTMEEKVIGQELNNADPINPPLAINEVSATESKGRRGFLWTLVSQLFVLGWLACIIALLTLNFQGYIAGASIGCGVVNCNDNTDMINSTHISQQLDTKDHNILGVLQLVAKTLEVWFILLAGCLVYDLTMLLARRGNGLPLRYFTTPSEFAELRGLLDRSFWTSAVSSTDHSQSQGTVTGTASVRTRKLTLFGFILFVATICIVSNLMGPATAVLLLPTLVWRDVQVPQTQAFFEMASREPPRSTQILTTCDAPALAAGRYSCSKEAVGNELDSSLLSQQSNMSALTLGSEEGLAFSLDFFYNPLPISVPNRQTMLQLDLDYLMWVFSGQFSYARTVSLVETVSSSKAVSPAGTVSLSKSTYNALRNSQQVKLQRQGPAFFYKAQCYPDVSVIHISDDKVVRCYDFPNPDRILYNENGFLGYPNPISTVVDGNMMSTMCVRVGPGWVGGNAHSNFSIGSSSANSIAVDVYSSDRAIYLTSTTYHCSADKIATGAAPCNWDALFSADPELDNIFATLNPSVTEYSLPDHPTTWCRSFAHLAFPTYTLDTSAATNPLTLVVLDYTELANLTYESIFVHPDWTLAAWSVDKGQTVPPARDGAQSFVTQFLSSQPGYDIINHILVAHSVVGVQSLSLIDYSMKDIDAAGSAPSPSNPVLAVNLLILVWSYGLESRTSKLGVMVAIMGCVIVLIRMVVGVWARTVDRDMLGFLTAALEQRPPGVFEGLEEKEVGNVRFRMDNHEKAKFLFQ